MEPQPELLIPLVICQRWPAWLWADVASLGASLAFTCPQFLAHFGLQNCSSDTSSPVQVELHNDRADNKTRDCNHDFTQHWPAFDKISPLARSSLKSKVELKPAPA